MATFVVGDDADNVRARIYDEKLEHQMDEEAGAQDGLLTVKVGGCVQRSPVEGITAMTPASLI
jgi:hypothetical protein